MNYVLIVILAILLLLVIRGLMNIITRKITIYEYQRGLKYVNGKFISVLQPGKFLIYSPSTTVQVVDVRPLYTTINGQEVLSSDGITLKVSLAAQYMLVDPEKAINSVQSYHEALYLIIQMGLRKIIGSTTIDELMEKRDEFGPKLLEIGSSQMEEIGLQLISVDIKDIMLPGEVKKLFNQIVKARKEGLAALEKARGETAAMRSLANAARMMEDNPNLLQLRALQQMGESSGNTLVMGLQNGTLPLSMKGKTANNAPVEDTE